jgi:hypothetical protein
LGGIVDHQLVVAVATHKPYRMPDDPIYLPLHVGAALHPDVLPDMQGDDTGDNISAKNASYSELTGLYWLWKNCDAHYKGLVHYRRLLGSNQPKKRHAKDPYDKLVDGPELLGLLGEKDAVLARRRNYYIETVYDHYAHTMDGSQLDKMRDIIEDRCPEYLPAWDDLMRSTRVHVFNMFVMPGELLDDYCAWLFPLLFELENRLDTSGMDAFAARWPGRVSERMLDPWLATNGVSYAELPVVSPEPVDWVKKGSSFLAAKFLGKKYEESF